MGNCDHLECPICNSKITEEDSVCPYCGALIVEPTYDIESDLENADEE